MKIRNVITTTRRIAKAAFTRYRTNSEPYQNLHGSTCLHGTDELDLLLFILRPRLYTGPDELGTVPNSSGTV